MPRVRGVELASTPGERSDAVRSRVVAARVLLDSRPPKRDEGASELLRNAVDRLHLSGRGHARVGRVARTVAALAGAETVGTEHVAEALAYRSPDELRDV